MKILVTGYNGQLGFDVIKELNSRSIECKGVDRDDFDITNREDTVGYICGYAPDAVIHCAAYTAVDRAEDDEENCRRVNVDGTENIAIACERLGAKMLYVSTDYVYGGAGDAPFEPSDPTDPKNVYGRTKLDGEKAVMKHLKNYFVVRTSWVFGINGNNFVKTMLKLADMGKTELNVVCDQIGSITYTYDLSKLLCDMIETEKYGIYHATNEGYISWAEFAEEIFKLSNRNVKINFVTTDEYKKLIPVQADRPLNSRMSKISLDKAGFNRLPDWKDAISRYLKEIE